jgi:hypothetical protein
MKSGVTMLLVAAVFAGGCGGDDEKSTAADKPGAAQADASAKAAARTAVSEMEACYVDSMSYADCKPFSGGAEVSGATDVAYTITGKSTSGNSFVIAKEETGLKRTCTTKGEGGCPAAGTW